MNALLNWLDDRTGIKGLLHEALYERVPGGAKWRYVWGSTLTFAFTVQLITGVFLFGYAASRFLVEFVREPDAHLGYLLGGATMGQLLSIPMALLGLAILVWSRRASN